MGRFLETFDEQFLGTKGMSLLVGSYNYSENCASIKVSTTSQKEGKMAEKLGWKIDDIPDDEDYPEEDGCRVVFLMKQTKCSDHDIQCNYDSEGRIQPYAHHRWYNSKGMDRYEADKHYWGGFDECEEYIGDLDRIKIPKFIREEVRKHAKSKQWAMKDGLKGKVKE